MIKGFVFAVKNLAFPISAIISSCIDFIRTTIFINLNGNIRYRSVDLNREKGIVHLMCNWTRAEFSLQIKKLVRECEILCNMSPEQTCFIGIYIGEELKSISKNQERNEINECVIELHRKEDDKSLNKIDVKDRYGRIKFFEPDTGELIIATPTEIASNKKYINSFDPSSALLVGIDAGVERKMNRKSYRRKFKKPVLRIVSSEN